LSARRPSKRSALAKALDRLERLHGPQKSLPASGPFELVLWENVAYLVSDDKRARAFAELKKRVGLRPRDILEAPPEVLYSIAAAGMKPELRVGALREAAETAMESFAGETDSVLSLPEKDAMRILKKFPGIGEPGAEKILLFSRARPLFALESNGLRVLLRLGYGREQKSYSTTYRSVREAVAEEVTTEVDWLIRAHTLLRRHGQEICKRSAPLCESCPLSEECAFFSSRESRSP
jgi:endonuclease-3